MSAIKTKAMRELLDALERAGVAREQVKLPTPLSHAKVERADLDLALTFEEEEWYFEGDRWFGWQWNLWGRWRPQSSLRLACLDSGRWESLEGMVAKVVEFLGEGA